MRKTFIVEVEYNESPENVKNGGDVLYETGIEIAMENLIENYKSTGSIIGDYDVKVKQK